MYAKPSRLSSIDPSTVHWLGTRVDHMALVRGMIFLCAQMYGRLRKVPIDEYKHWTTTQVGQFVHLKCSSIYLCTPRLRCLGKRFEDLILYLQNHDTCLSRANPYKLSCDSLLRGSDLSLRVVDVLVSQCSLHCSTAICSHTVGRLCIIAPVEE